MSERRSKVNKNNVEVADTYNPEAAWKDVNDINVNEMFKPYNIFELENERNTRNEAGKIVSGMEYAFVRVDNQGEKEKRERRGFKVCDDPIVKAKFASDVGLENRNVIEREGERYVLYHRPKRIGDAEREYRRHKIRTKIQTAQEVRNNFLGPDDVRTKIKHNGKYLMKRGR